MEVDTRVTLVGETQFKGTGHTPHEVRIDYLPPHGQDDGFMSTELLLLSLAGCSAQTVLAVLRKRRKTVSAFEVRASGTRRDEHPTVFTNIRLEYRLRGKGLDRASVEKAIRMSEEKYCPVWAMLKDRVEMTWSCSVEADGVGEETT